MSFFNISFSITFIKFRWHKFLIFIMQYKYHTSYIKLVQAKNKYKIILLHCRKYESFFKFWDKGFIFSTWDAWWVRQWVQFSSWCRQWLPSWVVSCWVFLWPVHPHRHKWWLHRRVPYWPVHTRLSMRVTCQFLHWVTCWCPSWWSVLSLIFLPQRW